MATIRIGYDASGNALDYTTHAAAITAAASGDTLETYFGNNARHPEFYENNLTITDKSLTLIGKISPWPIISSFSTNNHIFNVTGTGATNTVAFSQYILFGSHSTAYVACVGIWGTTITNKTVTVDKCIIISSGRPLITNGTSQSNCSMTVTNCLIYSGTYPIGVASGTLSPIYAQHCTIIAALNPLSRGGGELRATNCAIFSNQPCSGLITGSHNACLNSTNVPSTGRIVMDYATNNPHLWRNQSLGSMFNLMNYDITPASCLYRAGTNSGVTEDILGRPRHQTTPSIGAFEGQPIPTHPTASNVKSGITYIDLSGSTQTGTYSPDFPDVGNVRDTDTVDGVTGTLSSNKILKSNTTGSGAGNWNDDNLTGSTTDNVREDVAYGLGWTGTLPAYSSDEIVSTSGGNWNVDNLSADNVREDVAYGLNWTGTLPAYSPDEIVSTSGGNWNVANLSADNVRKDVAYGLNQTGTLEGAEQTATPTRLEVTPAGNGLGYHLEASYGPGGDYYYPDGTAILIYDHASNDYVGAVSPWGNTEDIDYRGQTIYIRAQEPGKVVSDRFPADSGYVVDPLELNYADAGDVLEGRTVRVDGQEIAGTSGNLTAQDSKYIAIEATRNTDPGEDNVLLNVPYTVRGAGKTGTFTADVISLPRPTLTVSVGVSHVVFTVSGSHASAENRIYVRPASAKTWPTVPAALIVGDGSGQIFLPPSGVYMATVVSTLGDGETTGKTDPVYFSVIAPGAKYTRSEFGAEMMSDIGDILLEFGEPITYRRGLQTIAMRGIRGKIDQEPSPGSEVIIGDAYWEISADALDFGAGVFTPRLHDQIIDGSGNIWNVIGEGEMDGERIFWRIPVKRDTYSEGA